MLAMRHMTVPTKIVPRRPSRLLMGSESHAPLSKSVSQLAQYYADIQQATTHVDAAVDEADDQIVS